MATDVVWLPQGFHQNHLSYVQCCPGIIRTRKRESCTPDKTSIGSTRADTFHLYASLLAIQTRPKTHEARPLTKSRPGTPTSPERSPLVLLPSGPDTVQEFSPHGTRSGRGQKPRPKPVSLQ